jgi:hypothetical protein
VAAGFYEEENMMRRFILAGLVLSATLIIPMGATSTAAEWCRLARAEGGRECIFHTFEQCAASTERLNGGGCVPNTFGDSAPPAGIRGVRAIRHQVPRHRPHHHDADR